MGSFLEVLHDQILFDVVLIFAEIWQFCLRFGINRFDELFFKLIILEIIL